MRKSFNLNIYGDDALKEKFERVKAYHLDKNPGIPISDSAIGAILIDEAYHKILGAQTNADRITKIVEELRQLRASHDALSKLIKAREGEL